MTAIGSLEAIRDEWSARWGDALALWSPYLRLHAPRFCLTEADEREAGLVGSFAMIRLVDQSVVVSLRQVRERLAAFPLEILGHEIGHHVLCPADLSDNARLIARIRRSLPSVERHAPMVANLYADLLINDRLQRGHGLDMAGVYRAIDDGTTTALWSFYLRTYEILWSLQRGTLHRGLDDDRIEGDAMLGARLVRSYAGRWLDGAGRFAALCLSHLLADAAPDETAGATPWRVWQDAVGAGAGGLPDGLTEVDPDEARGAIHPAFDPDLGGSPPPAPATATDAAEAPPADDGAHGTPGQFREPFEYGDLLRDCGIVADDHEIAVRYYRERAARHLVPFPVRVIDAGTDPLPEGVETWEVGGQLSDIDWVETLLRSPHVIPGVTTVERMWGTSPGAERERVPFDLDLYVDSSGSMPNPQATTSYLTLAGAVIALSALRAGASVQVTLWSGARQFTSTAGFVRDEHRILEVLTGFFGGATAFPIHVLRDTYAHRPVSARPAHVLVISDDGVTTMFDLDEAGRDGRDVVNHALATAGGGASMVLNLWRPIDEDPALLAAQDDGWQIDVVRDWADLLAFARRFSASRYGDLATSPARTGATS